MTEPTKPTKPTDPLDIILDEWALAKAFEEVLEECREELPPKQHPKAEGK